MSGGGGEGGAAEPLLGGVLDLNFNDEGEEDLGVEDGTPAGSGVRAAAESPRLSYPEMQPRSGGAAGRAAAVPAAVGPGSRHTPTSRGSARQLRRMQSLAQAGGGESADAVPRSSGKRGAPSSVNENIACVARVLYRHIALRDASAGIGYSDERRAAAAAAEEEGGGDEERCGLPTREFTREESEAVAAAFSADLLVARRYKVLGLAGARVHSHFAFRQRQKDVRMPRPTVPVLASFMRRVFELAHLNPECCIISLIYTERLLEFHRLTLDARNWMPIVMVSLLLASKVWDDLSSWNVEFCEVYPMFGLRTVNRLERHFLDALDWNVSISGAQYARYYFALREFRPEIRRLHQQKKSAARRIAGGLGGAGGGGRGARPGAGVGARGSGPRRGVPALRGFASHHSLPSRP